MKNRYLIVMGLMGAMFLSVNSVLADSDSAGSTDGNADTAVEKHEDMREKLKNMTPEEKQAYFKKRREERLANMTPEQREAFEKRQAERIARFDTDGDGKLSDTERAAARKEMHAKMLERFDKDGDGKLSEDERRAAREARREHMKQQHDDAKDNKQDDVMNGPENRLAEPV